MKQKHTFIAVVLAAMSLAITGATSAENNLPDPDGKPADMSKPVQVYILMGQSNMVGAGHVKGDKEGSLTNAVQKKKFVSLPGRRRGPLDRAQGRALRAGNEHEAVQQ